MSLFAQMCLEQQPDKEIVFDVKCSLMVQRTVERLGGKPKMIRTEVASCARIYPNQMVTLFLGANTRVIMYLMMGVVLGMMMVCTLHYV